MVRWILALALGVPVLVPAGAQAATCVVGAGGTYLAIAPALADPTCTDIQVRPGTYRETPLLLARSGTTVSAQPGTVNVTSTGSVVLTVSGSDDVVRGLGLQGATGVRVTGARVTLDRLVVNGGAHGVDVTGNAAQVLRSQLTAATTGGDALFVHATGAADRTAAVDSSILASKVAGSVGLRARSDTKSSGNVSVTLVHATIVGGALMDQNGVAGRVKAQASRSIVQGPPGGMTTELSDTTTPAAQLFRDPASDWHLRADAPVIDQDGAVRSGESDQDVDGEPRVAGARSDLGADEFVNQAPVPALAVDGAAPRQNATVTFDASGSVDPEAAWGGGLTRFDWDFGDGTTDSTTTPTTDHAYPERGRYSITVHVVDKQGAEATSTPVAIYVRDGIPPSLSFATPHPWAWVRPTISRFNGVARDRSGVGPVYLSLGLTKYPDGRVPRGGCRFLNPATRRYVTRSCSRPLYFRVQQAKGRWSYATRHRFRLARGRWQATVKTADKAGNRASRTVRFSVR